MKKKIVAMCLVVALAVVAIGGATLAYFTDTDKADNVFTTGKVDITLNDEFEQNSKLVPAVIDEDGTIQNGVDKVVSVTNNLGSEEAYVRVHIAVPESIAELITIWYNGESENWDWDNDIEYVTKINDVNYEVICLTYSEKLAANATSDDVFRWVVMDPTATNDDVAAVNGNFDIKVFAEGAQAAGFDNAYDALNTSFGEAGTYCPWGGTLVTAD